MARLSLAVVVCCASFTLSVALSAQRGGGGTNPIASLKGVALPQRPNLSQYVADNQSLVALGKALFWDVQVGSDGQTSCATCHFHAGSDHRVTNTTAGPATSTAAVRANTTLTAGDFPFHAVGNTNVIGSAGVVKHTFAAITDGAADEVGGDTSGAGLFVVGGVKVRQVTSRNAPSVINAVFNLRNFWDGRASNIFNAATPFGVADARAQVLALLGGTLTPQAVRLDGSSLASQAVAPPLNGLEMSYEGRAWTDLGRKMLSLTPLGRQPIARDDSVLGPFVSASGVGFRPDVTYASLVAASFQPPTPLM